MAVLIHHTYPDRQKHARCAICSWRQRCGAHYWACLILGQLACRTGRTRVCGHSPAEHPYVRINRLSRSCDLGLARPSHTPRRSCIKNHCAIYKPRMRIAHVHMHMQAAVKANTDRKVVQVLHFRTIMVRINGILAYTHRVGYLVVISSVSDTAVYQTIPCSMTLSVF